MKMKAVTLHDNYTVSFITLSVNWYNTTLILFQTELLSV
jgi:hypothetical protein